MQTEDFRLKSCSVKLRLNPYDSSVFKEPVYDILSLTVDDSERASKELGSLLGDLEAFAASSSSSILDYSINETLQRCGFVVADSTIEPYLLHEDWVDTAPCNTTQLSIIDQPSRSQRKSACEVARICFRNQRYHIDDRFDNTLADLRYVKWVESTESTDKQRLIVLADAEAVVGFFVTEELLGSKSVYWHLNAISPDSQGKGLGRLCWQKMINYHLSKGALSIHTTISCHNTRALRIYSSLGFRFRNHSLKMHWRRI